MLFSLSSAAEGVVVSLSLRGSHGSWGTHHPFGFTS
jgi:hypothetical protein